MSQIARGQRIQQAMHQQNHVILTALAKLIGRSESSTHSITNGINPRRSDYREIAAVLNITISWLFDGLTPPTWWTEHHDTEMDVAALKDMMNVNSRGNRYILINLGQSDASGVYLVGQNDVWERVESDFLHTIS